MKELTNLPARPADAPAASFSLGDVYFIFFRHKWKILLIFLVGLAGAFGVYKTRPPVYQSEARILIRYVVDSQPQVALPGAIGDKVLSTDSRGDGIMISQIEILTSFDLAVRVAELVGPERILARAGGGTNVNAAAGMIRGGLLVEPPRRGSVVRILFRHPDPSVVQPVLNQLVESYLEKHKGLYQLGGIWEEHIARQAEIAQSRLSQTEDELKKLKSEAQILSLSDSMQLVVASRGRIEQELFAAQAELAEQIATLAAWEKLRPGQAAVAAVELGVPPDIADRYRTASAELEYFQNRRSDLQYRFKDEHPQLRRVLGEIARVESEKRELELQFTNLVSLTPPPAPLAPPGAVDLTTQILRVSALEAKIRVYTNQLARVQAGADSLLNLEPKITRLQRQKEADEASLQNYLAGLQKTRNDEEMGGGKVTNIKTVQTPTPPFRDLSGVMKPLAAVLAFGLFGGFALAFLIEKFLNQNLRRVVDLERLVRAPVFVTVPDLGRKYRRLLANGDALPAPSANGSGPSPGKNAVTTHSGEIAPWDGRHVLRSYYEGLRDRLITYFEVRNLTHKPKLVAVTSCKTGAGVTTMAAGLAATLSETGDGNVLLVDMNLEQGAAHQFYQGRPGCALSDALENSTRDSAQVQENLYLVSAHETKNEKLPRALPKRFAHLIPRMKASDYDYIIFDMPPITQTSVTPRLAGLMDMVLVVVESETTSSEIVKRAHALLHESRATVATVLNKHRAYVPERLGQGL